jgi:hypothetical protein
MKLLQRLRKRKRTVAGVILPLVATVWFSASASACLGMAVEGLDLAPDGAAAHAHDHSDHQQSHAGDPPGTHSVSETHDHGQSSPSHGPCPHCVGSSNGSSSVPTEAHGNCSVLEGVSASTVQPSVQKWELTHFLSAVQPVPFAAHAPPRRVPTSLHSAPTLDSPIPINLRHCVFLI